MDSELSISPVTPASQAEEVKSKWKKVPKQPIELNRNDLTSSSVETEKATYDVWNTQKPPVQARVSDKKPNPEKQVFAYNKYLGAM